MFQVTNKQELLMIKLTKFFCIPKNIEKMIPIIESKSVISLRIIDWFVTNYSKKFNISYNNTNKKNKEEKCLKQFIVYLNYKKQLKAYSKKEFDPFCRRERITFYYSKEKYITTTVGQLNFFRWAIINNVIKYIEKNLKEIETDMNLSLKKNNTKLSENSYESIKRRKKRQELSVSATKKVNKHNVKILVQFE